MRTIAIALFALAAGCSGTSEAQPRRTERPLSVVLTSALEIEVPRTLSLTGTLTAAQESDVAADATGRVLSTHAERGDIVRAGAPLARIDVRTAGLQAAEARANLESARAEEARARLECARSDALWDRRAISDGVRDTDRARCTAAAASVKAAEARLRLATKSIGDGVVRAPFAGMVAERPVAAGEYVRADTRVATLLQTDTLRLELTVPEADALAIAAGQTVRFDVAAVPGRTFEGTIRYVGPALRRGSRDLIVEAVVPNGDGQLRPGMFAVSEVRLGVARATAIPRTAIRTEDGTGHVFVAKDGRLEERVVRMGPAAGQNATVLEGIAAGERVVAAVGPETQDGRAFEAR